MPDDIASTGTVVTGSFNLIGTGGSGGLAGGNGNQIGVSNASVNLGSLADNGGPTETIALEAGSSAINAGSNALDIDPNTGEPLSTDQRGPATGGSKTISSISALSRRATPPPACR